MEKQVEFSFGDDSIAKAYDNVLVPALFEPWAAELIHQNGPWDSYRVLDLACGTGVVTKELAKNVGENGKVISLDINKQMLKVAKMRCQKWADKIEFVEGSALNLQLDDDSIDKLVCQQGFQFFPDKKVAAQEIYRVLKPGSQAVLATWSNVTECEIFGAICGALESLNLNDISKMMRMPFDLLTIEGLLDAFTDIGYSKIETYTKGQPLKIEGGVNEAVNFVYATPIGPKLLAQSTETQNSFKRLFSERLQKLTHKDGSFGLMVSNMISLEK